MPTKKTNKMLTPRRLSELLKGMAHEAGSQRALAQQLEYDESRISKIILCRLDARDSLLQKLGYQRLNLVRYVKIQ